MTDDPAAMQPMMKNDNICGTQAVSFFISGQVIRHLIQKK